MRRTHGAWTVNRSPTPERCLDIRVGAGSARCSSSHAEAEPFCREVLVGFTKALGEEHPFTISSAENLVGVLRSLGKREDECQHLLDRFGLKEPPRRRGDGPARKEIRNTVNGSPPLDEVD